MKKRIIIIVALILVGVAAFLYYKNWRRQFLNKDLPNLVFLKSDSVYRISYDDLYVNEVAGEIRIKNLQLQPDTTYRKSTDSSLPKNLLRVSVPELHVTGVRTDMALLNKEINAARITISNPVVTMFNTKPDPKNEEGYSGNDSGATTSSIYQILLRGLQRIRVDTISISGADYHICKWRSSDTSFSGNGIHAQLYTLDISDSTSTDTSRILFAKQADLQVEKIRIRDKKGMYNYVMNEIALQSNASSFKLKSAFISPTLGEAAFVKAAKWQTDRLNIDLTGLDFNGINVQSLLDGNLVSKELVIKGAAFRIFRDKSYPRKTGPDKAPTYPQQLFTQIPVHVSIKKMVVNQAYIEYKEKNPKTASSGVVHFNKVSATLFNVTNRPADLRENAICTVKFSSLFLNKVPFSATLHLYPGHEKGRFAAKGSMGAVDAAFFNPLTKPLALLMINSGTVNRLEFSFTGNNYAANGSVKLLYENLNVTLLKADEDNKQQLGSKKLASFLANASIKNNNPGKNNSLRIATVNNPRDDSKGIFNLIWKTILAGLIKTIGIEGKMP
jgi:hypothetical protein